MLSINPYLARQSGFYLGFFISLSFYFAKDALTRGRKFRFISKTSVFAFLFMLPLSLSDSATFHVLGIFIQFILTPYTFIFMLLSLVSLYSYPIRPLFTFMANSLTSLMKGLSYIDITIPFKEFGSVFTLIYYLVLFSCSLDLINSIKDGNIAYELCRPQDLYYMWLSRILGDRVARVILRFPLVLIVCALLPLPYKLDLSISIVNFLVFIVALILSAILATVLILLFHIIGYMIIIGKYIIY